jgi:hypothetical protein
MSRPARAHGAWPAIAIGLAAAMAAIAVAAASTAWLTAGLGAAGVALVGVGSRWARRHALVPGVALVTLAVATAQPGRTALAPLEVAGLVLVLLAGWRALDERWPITVAPRSARAATVTVIVLALASLALGVVLLAAARLDTTGVIGPIAGATAAVAVAAAGWAATRLDRLPPTER